MADNLDAVARLSVLVSGAKEWANDLERMKEGSLDLHEGVNKLQKKFRDLDKANTAAAKELKKGGKSAKDAGKDAKKAAGDWDKYTEAIEAAQKAHRADAKAKVQATTPSDAIPAKSASQMTGGERQALLSANDAQNSSVVASARQQETYLAKLKETSRNNERKDLEKAHTAALKENEARIKGEQRVAAERRTASKEAIAGIDRAAAATDKRFAAESKRDKQSRKSSQMSMSEWDKQFKAAEKATKASAGGVENAARARYALYDVARTTAVIGTAITGIGLAAAAAAASVESSFTNVERTLDDVGSAQVEKLREDLMGLTREIPRTFSDVAGIATLGNQLGIASTDVASFTETVAQFSTVTGMTADASATAFGSLNELLPGVQGNYEKLGSAIALVGRRSVATEQEIVAMTTRLAASASKAGFTTEQVVGLAGAFASLRIAPERAQGVMEIYFKRLNTALANGGPALDAFAHYAGVATSEVEALVRADPVAYFERLSTGLGSLDQVAQTRALDQLGLDGIRAGEVFGRVSANVDVFRQAVADSNQGYREGSELAKQYALVVDDLASRFQIFQNAVVEAGAAVGASLAPAITFTLDLLSKMIQAFAAFAETPFGAGIVTVTAILGALVAMLAGLITVSALSAASFLALKTAFVDLGLGAIWASGGVRGLVGTLLGVGPAATAGAIGLRILRTALILTGIGAIIVALGFLIGLFIDFGGTMASIAQPIHFVIDLVVTLGQVIVATAQSVASFIGGLPGGGVFKDWANGLGVAVKEMENFKGDTHKEFDKWVKGLNKASDGTKGLGDAAKYATDYWEDFEGLDIPAEMGKIGGGAKQAAKEVRTLADYASDLGGVFSRAFEIRFGPGQGLDGISSGWSKIAKDTEAAREEMAGYLGELRDMTADRDIKAYWLSIAETYGDTLRAAKLREELADLDKKQAATSKKLAAAQDKASKTLEGNSDAAIENRAEILGLVGNYQTYIQSLASSGMSQSDLAAKSAQLKQEFVRQATQLGYSRSEVDKYATSFDDLSRIIRTIPRNVTIDANMGPAETALREFLAKANAAKASVGVGGGDGYGAGYAAGEAYGRGWVDGTMKNRRMIINYGQNVPGGITYQFAYSNGSRSLPFFSEGGYTGGGSPSDVAGVVHKKEFVFSAPAVRNLGLGNLSFLHQLGKSGKGFAPSGLAAGSGSAGISDAQIDKLARAIAYYNPLVIPGVAIQRADGMANAASSSQGRY